MRRKSFDEMECGIARCLDIVGDPWTLLIVREAMFGTRDFDGFRNALNIPKNTLSDRLTKLVDTDVLTRKELAEDRRRVSYHLTEAGRDLSTILVALSQWGNKWVFGQNAEPSYVADRSDRKRVRQIEIISELGRALELDDLMMIPGPSASAKLRKRFSDVNS